MAAWKAFAPRRTMQRGVLLAVATLVLFAASPERAGAQDARTEALVNRLERLERDLGALSRQVYRGEAPKGAPPAASSGGAALPGDYATRIEARMGALEGQITDLTGAVETLTHSNSELAAKLERLTKDYELRFQDLERGVSPRPRAQPASPNDAATAGAPPSTLGTLSQSDLNAAPKDAQPAQQAVLSPQPRVSLPQGTPQQQYDYAYGLIAKARQDSEYAAAAQAFQEFVDKNPSGSLASNARYWMGETYYVRGDYSTAARVFLEGYQKDQKGPKAPDSLLKLGMSLTYLDKKKEACATFDKLTKDFPAAAKGYTRLASERKRAGCA